MYDVLAQSALSRSKQHQAWRMIAQYREPDEKGLIQFILPGAAPGWKRWRGQKSYSGSRVLQRMLDFDQHHSSLRIKRQRVRHDDGSVAELLRRHANAGEYFFDELVFTKLDANPNGADGRPIIDGTHPYGPNGETWSNSHSTPFGHAAYNLAQERLGKRKAEGRQPLELKADTIVVGYDQRRIALEVAEADGRPVAVGTNSAQDGAGFGATSVTNVFRGSIANVVVVPWLRAGNWLVGDSAHPTLMGLGVWRDPEVHIADDMAGKDRMDVDFFKYSMESDANSTGLEPWAWEGRLQA